VRSSAAQPLAGRLARALARRFAARGGSEPPSTGLERRRPDGFLRPVDYYGPSLAVMFLFFSVLGGMRAFQAEADSGTLARLAATPVSTGEVLAGKIGGLILLGALQFAVLAAATGGLFGVRWGPLLPVAALAATTVLAAVGVLAFAVSAVGNAPGGWVLGSAVVFVLSLLGGHFLPPEGLPEIFDTLQRCTPNGQALRGFTDLASLGPAASFGLVREPLAVTAAVGVAGIAACALRLRRPRAPRA
jgi:ABC-2 type transport system permease protein